MNGPNGASTRGIASAAGVAMSTITYHYGGKGGLYLAAADHIAAGLAAEMEPALKLCEPIDSCNGVEARIGIHAILDRLAARMASDGSADWSLFILREQMDPSEAFDRIYSGMMCRVMTRISELVQITTGRAIADARVTAVTILGQVLAIRASRASIERLLNIERLDAPHATALCARIHENVDAILDRLSTKE